MNQHLLRCLIKVLIAAACTMHSVKVLAQAKEEFDNLVFFVPQGLSVSKSTNSLILTDAGTDTGKFFTITVNRSTVSLKKIEKTLPVFWKESLAMDGFDNPVEEPQFVKFSNNGGWDCYRGGRSVSYSAQSTPLYYHLTVVKRLGITIRIVTKASTEELFMQKIPLLMQLVASVDFKKQPPPQQQTPSAGGSSQGISNTGNSEPGYSKTSVAVQTYALYMSVQGDLSSNGEISVLYFLPDGTVYTDIPEKGFLNFNVQEQKGKTPDVFGTYSSSGSNILIKMNGDANGVVHSMRSDKTLQSSKNPALVYRKIESLENYHLEGIYNKKQEGSVLTVAFTRDGQFTDKGLIKNLTPNYNGTNAPGNGNYTITKNSLSLQYSDGRSLQLCMYIMPEDYSDKPPRVLLNNYVLTRL